MAVLGTGVFCCGSVSVLSLQTSIGLRGDTRERAHERWYLKRYRDQYPSECTGTTKKTRGCCCCCSWRSRRGVIITVMFQRFERERKSGRDIPSSATVRDPRWRPCVRTGRSYGFHLLGSNFGFPKRKHPAEKTSMIGPTRAGVSGFPVSSAMC